jgi:hypothetical protein
LIDFKNDTHWVSFLKSTGNEDLIFSSDGPPTYAEFFAAIPTANELPPVGKIASLN